MNFQREATSFNNDYDCLSPLLSPIRSCPSVSSYADSPINYENSQANSSVEDMRSILNLNNTSENSATPLHSLSSNWPNRLEENILSNYFILNQLINQQVNSTPDNKEQMCVKQEPKSNKSNRSDEVTSPITSYPSSVYGKHNGKLNMRRKSFGHTTSLLLPVSETGASSPIDSYSSQAHTPNTRKSIDSTSLETKINSMLIDINNNNNRIKCARSPPSFNLLTPPPTLHNSIDDRSMRLRATSLCSPEYQFNYSNVDCSNEGQSFLSNNKREQNAPTSRSLSSLYSSLSIDDLEEKLATSGNIFHKRDNWSIINKLPISKQNTIHMRLEDEGPYGNDEVRSFVLTHFSSLAINNMLCISCDCSLSIYDKFPLLDGTLFMSPVNYDTSKSIPTNLPTPLHKTHKQTQYIYAICLKCLMEDKDHEIACKHCGKSWQKNGGTSLQIGTLYKYDIFAAFPCCQYRLNCNACSMPIIKLESNELPYFSSYSEEHECFNCNIKSFHFIKPLANIFNKSLCYNEDLLATSLGSNSSNLNELSK